MNLKTTIFLLVLILIGAAGWVAVTLVGPATVTSATLATLKRELKTDAITRIEISHGDKRIVLEKGADGWSLPGKWPVRQTEVKQLVEVLSNLRSRFAPIAAGDNEQRKKLGLEGANAVQVTVKARGKDYKLSFGEESGDGSRFSRPTYLRLDDAAEALRVAPGLLTILDRPQEYYMQRRLFPVERVAKEGGESGEKIEQVAAKSVSAKGGGQEYIIARAGDGWELSKPLRDRVDPDKVKGILAGLPDIWVEKFVDTDKKKLDDFGLKDPAQTIQVQLPRGDTVTLLIGKTSDKQMRLIKKAGGPPFGKPSVDVIETEFKFAKLKDNDQVFEIKADKLKDIVVAADALRDPLLARFKSDDVKKLTITEGGKSLVFVKGDDGWKLEKPAYDADRGRVDDILEKLAALRAGEKDILDMADPKAFGLDKPTTITIVVAKDAKDGDKGKSASKSKKTTEFTFLLGKQQGEKGKLYVQMAGWGRINIVDGDLFKLAQRPALAYRNRRVLNFATSDASRIDVQRGGEKYALEQAKGDWRLAAPVQAELDSKARDLPRELSQLEAVEFVTAEPRKEDLDKVYRLAKPEAIIKVSFTDKKKPVQAVEIGGKKSDGKDEYYARLESDPTIFTIKKDVFDTLTRDSLAYRPTEPWKVDAEDIAEVKTEKGAEKFALERDGDGWKVTGPFTASIPADLVRPLTDELAKLKIEKYVAHAAANLADYGLDKPYLRVALREKPSGGEPKPTGKDKEKAKESKERVLLIGKPTAKDARSRYARLGDSEAIFILSDKAVAAVDRGPLDFIDRKLIALPENAVKSIRFVAGKDSFTLKRDKDDWRIERGDGPSFVADAESADDSLHAWGLLRAQKLAAYGDKLDLAPFGLDKPAAIVIATVQDKGEKDKPGKTVEHKLLLGSEVKGTKGDRYVMLEGKPAVAILDAAVVADLQRTPLDFVNRSLLKLDPAKITGLSRAVGSDVLELSRKGDAWHIVKPADRQADEATLRSLTADLALLRGKKVAAYPAKDLKPFGLDVPAAAIVISGADDKTAKHTLFIGKLVDDKSGTDRFARLDKSDIVVVLPGRLADELLAPALQFRDRLLAKSPPIAKVVVDRGVRKATFTKIDGDWKMTDPAPADAERTELDDFVKSFAELRADKLVAEKPADLKPYGLDRPQARWQLFSADAKQPPLSLLIGGKDKGGKRLYAKLADGDLVFLLDDKLSGQALAEYRARKIWPALDSFQIEKLTFGYEKTPFTLQKMGGDWQVAGKPDLKIKAEAVRDTLDALARLKADQWVVDKNGDPKDFGLDPPLLSLEIETSSGKRTLKIGRQEGGSGRYYAIVQGENSGAVFFIGEAEARAIVRPLAALLAGKA